MKSKLYCGLYLSNYKLMCDKLLTL